MLPSGIETSRLCFRTNWTDSDRVKSNVWAQLAEEIGKPVSSHKSSIKSREAIELLVRIAAQNESESGGQKLEPSYLEAQTPKLTQAWKGCTAVAASTTAAKSTPSSTQVRTIECYFLMIDQISPNPNRIFRTQKSSQKTACHQELCRQANRNSAGLACLISSGSQLFRPWFCPSMRKIRLNLFEKIIVPLGRN